MELPALLKACLVIGVSKFSIHQSHRVKTLGYRVYFMAGRTSLHFLNGTRGNTSFGATETPGLHTPPGSLSRATTHRAAWVVAQVSDLGGGGFRDIPGHRFLVVGSPRSNSAGTRLASSEDRWLLNWSRESASHDATGHTAMVPGRMPEASPNRAPGKSRSLPRGITPPPEPTDARWRVRCGRWCDAR